MSDRDKYNGWTNRETWLVNVWYNPESREDVEYARADLEEKRDAMGYSCIADMCGLSRVNWDELLEHFPEEEEEEDE